MRTLSIAWLLAGGLLAQAPADVVDDDALLDRIEANCSKLREQGGLRKVAELARDADGRRCELPAVPLRSPALAPPELRARLLESALIVGHYYRCDECKDWHFSASSGFAVGADGLVATCFHLLDDDPDMPDARLLVADWRGEVWPVLEVVAGDRSADLAIVRCGRTGLVPLPLRLDARAGERVFCLSNPDHQFACFTDGLIARRYVVHGPAPGTEPAPPANAASGAHQKKPDPAARAVALLQVTCEFAVGSSGAPVTDACGNVVGIAQSTSTVFVDPDAKPPETQMVMRTAVPAAALRALAKP